MTTHEQSGGPGSYIEQELEALRAERVTWIENEQRWMQIEDNEQGGCNMNPVNPRCFLRGPQEQLPDMAGVSETMLTKLQVKTNAIMKKVTLNPSVYAREPPQEAHIR